MEIHEFQLDCLACNKPIILNESNYKKQVLKCWDGYYIICPSCHRALSLETYKGKGRLPNDLCSET